ncbi:hypothetical protein [Ornithinimicrobium panacihumi]|uniref:hypothetical protein n=1 Tax=Ornithinimicrobium panacihumi TaxID=2008449 RepID=UPI003F8B6E77
MSRTDPRPVAGSDAGLALILDADRLSDLVGEPVRAVRIRPKPAVTHVAALLARSGGAHAEGTVRGWVRTLQGQARLKADKVRAAQDRCRPGPDELGADKNGPAELAAGETGPDELAAGETVLEGEDVLVLWGPVRADLRLARELEMLPASISASGASAPAWASAPASIPASAAGAGTGAGHLVLRYNPGRRLVVRDGDVVHRITTDGHRSRLTRLTRALRDQGVPVVTPLEQQPVDRRRISSWPWVPGEDASSLREPSALRAIGAHLRHLHSLDPATLPELPRTGWAQLRRAGLASVQQLLEMLRLDGDAADLVLLAEQARHVLEARVNVADGPLVVSHGDFSLDQCLQGPHGTLLTDFDRATLAPRELDLASVVAAGIVDHVPGSDLARSTDPGAVADLVLDGYLGGRAPTDLTPWVMASLLGRSMQHWRGQGPDWRERTRRLLLAATALDVRVPDVVLAAGDRIVVGRAWPGRAPKNGRGLDGAAPLVHVAVEGRDGQGRLRAGTWASDGTVTMLPFGEDSGLPGLRDLADQGELVVHRPGRRAVVRLDASYAKVVRRGRAAQVAEAGTVGQSLAGRAGLRAPRVLSVDGDVLHLETVPGRPLHDLSGSRGWDAAWTRWEGAWSSFQALPHTGLGLGVHTWADEADGLRDWAAKVAPLLAGTPWPTRLEEVASLLDEAHRRAEQEGHALVPTHRDLHDKQLLWDGTELSVLDLDTACLAPPVLDPANLAVHADLRVAQGVWTAAEGEVVVDRAHRVALRGDAAAAGLDGRDELSWELAGLATRARLVAIYAYRPRWRELVLDWAGQGWSEAFMRVFSSSSHPGLLPTGHTG